MKCDVIMRMRCSSTLFCRQEMQQGTQDSEACDSLDAATEASQDCRVEEDCQGKVRSSRVPEASCYQAQGAA